jgi:hypothetical protein
MAEALPPIEFDENAAGVPIVIVGEVQVQELSKLLDTAPALLDPNYVAVYAQLVNHLAKGYSYNVIMDPDAFRTAYMEKRNAEDPDAPVNPAVPRLRNFGIPDFDSITTPAIDGDKLVFFAEDLFLGIPYRAEAPATHSAIGEPVYLPVEMQPTQ